MSVVEDATRLYRSALPVLGVSLLGGLVAGTVLGTPGMRGALARYPGVLLMLPALLATRGNVYGALGARIATGLHQGLVEPRITADERLVNAVSAAIVNGVLVAGFIALAAWSYLAATGRPHAGLPVLLGVALVSTALSAVAMITTLLSLLFLGYRAGYDPDVLMGPIVTTTGDVFGVVNVYVAIVLVGVVT